MSDSSNSPKLPETPQPLRLEAAELSSFPLRLDSSARAERAPVVLLEGAASHAQQAAWADFVFKLEKRWLSEHGEPRSGSGLAAEAMRLAHAHGGVHAISESGYSPLNWVCSRFRVSALPVALALLQSGADPDSCAGDGQTPLMGLCESLRGAELQVGAEAHNYPRVPHQKYHSLLIEHRDAVALAIQALLAHGATPNHEEGAARHREGDTPLHAAAREDGLITRLLAQAGARVEAKSRTGETPLWAALGGPPESAEALLEFGANPREPGPEAPEQRFFEPDAFVRSEPLAWLACRDIGRREWIRDGLGTQTRNSRQALALVQRGADIFMRGAGGETLLQKALERGVPDQNGVFEPGSIDFPLLLWLYARGAPLENKIDPKATEKTLERMEAFFSFVQPEPGRFLAKEFESPENWALVERAKMRRELILAGLANPSEPPARAASKRL